MEIVLALNQFMSRSGVCCPVARRPSVSAGSETSHLIRPLVSRDMFSLRRSRDPRDFLLEELVVVVDDSVTRI